MSLRSLPLALLLSVLACGDDGRPPGGGGGGAGGEGTGGLAAGGQGAGGSSSGGQGTGGANEGGAPTPGEITVWTQATDGGTSLGEDNADYADYAREILHDEVNGRRYVIGWGYIEGATEPDGTMVGFIRAYDAETAEVVGQLRVGSTSPGRETRLFNGVFGEEGGERYLYVSGKTDTSVVNLCSDPAAFPSQMGNSSTDGLLLQIDLDTFTIADCMAIKSSDDEFDEIAALEWDEVAGALWIAGSTRGVIVPGSRQAGNLPGVGGDVANDFYAARVPPTLDNDPQFIQFGSVEFDEALGSYFDPATQTLFVGGSTKGNLCDAFPDESTALGYACSDGQGAALGDNFDSYLAAIRFDPPSTLTRAWIYQFGEGSGAGADDNDVVHDLVLHEDGAGATYLYEAGYMSGGAAADARLGRLRLDALHNPAVVGGAADFVTTRIADPAGYGDNAATLFLGQDHVWVTLTMHGGADHAHGGPCGEGPESANEGHLMGFAHETFGADAAPTHDFARVLTKGNPDQRSTSFEGLAYAEGRFWISGNTTGGPSEAHCGPEPTKAFDDESDAIVFYLEHASP